MPGILGTGTTNLRGYYRRADDAGRMARRKGGIMPQIKANFDITDPTNGDFHEVIEGSLQGFAICDLKPAWSSAAQRQVFEFDPAYAAIVSASRVPGRVMCTPVSQLVPAYPCLVLAPMTITDPWCCEQAEISGAYLWKGDLDPISNCLMVMPTIGNRAYFPVSLDLGVQSLSEATTGLDTERTLGPLPPVSMRDAPFASCAAESVRKMLATVFALLDTVGGDGGNDHRVEVVMDGHLEVIHHKVGFGIGKVLRSNRYGL